MLHFSNAPPLARTHGHACARRFQEVSFFLLLCGGPGSGKSMRARRMMALLPEGWVHPSGSASQKAGMNGGFDNLCGRLVYYDGASPFSQSLPQLCLTLVCPLHAQRSPTTLPRRTRNGLSERAFEYTPPKTPSYSHPITFQVP